jgi:hypothetical protein
VNQWPEEEPRTREIRRPAPGAYGSVHPAQDQARRLAERMRESLAAVGFDVDRDFPSLHGDTTVALEPFLTLGRLSADVGERLIAALTGRAVLTGTAALTGAAALSGTAASAGAGAGSAVGAAVVVVGSGAPPPEGAVGRRLGRLSVAPRAA